MVVAGLRRASGLHFPLRLEASKCIILQKQPVGSIVWIICCINLYGRTVGVYGFITAYGL